MVLGCELEYFQRVRRDPNVELLEARFQPLLEFDEELSVFRQIWHIDEYPYQIIPEFLALMSPESTDVLGFARHCTKSCSSSSSVSPSTSSGTARPSLNRSGSSIS